MTRLNRKLLKWERDCDRFRITDRFPPKPTRPEKKISDILSTVLKSRPVEKGLPELITDRWPLVVGQQLAKHTKPSHLREKILYVYADHPGWLTELRRLPKNHILKKLSKIPDAPPILDIRFLLDPAIKPKSRR